MHVRLAAVVFAASEPGIGGSGPCPTLHQLSREHGDGRPLDLRPEAGWVPVTRPEEPPGGRAEWQWPSTDIHGLPVLPGSRAVQANTKAQDPAWLLSPDDYIDVIIRGRISVDDPVKGDDDWIGFTLGHQHPASEGEYQDPASPHQYLLFDWSRANKKYCWAGDIPGADPKAASVPLNERDLLPCLAGKPACKPSSFGDWQPPIGRAYEGFSLLFINGTEVQQDGSCDTSCCGKITQIDHTFVPCLVSKRHLGGVCEVLWQVIASSSDNSCAAYAADGDPSWIGARTGNEKGTLCYSQGDLGWNLRSGPIANVSYPFEILYRPDMAVIKIDGIVRAKARHPEYPAQNWTAGRFSFYEMSQGGYTVEDIHLLKGIGPAGSGVKAHDDVYVFSAADKSVGRLCRKASDGIFSNDWDPDGLNLWMWVTADGMSDMKSCPGAGACPIQPAGDLDLSAPPNFRQEARHFNTTCLHCSPQKQIDWWVYDNGAFCVDLPSNSSPDDGYYRLPYMVCNQKQLEHNAAAVDPSNAPCDCFMGCDFKTPHPDNAAGATVYVFLEETVTQDSSLEITSHLKEDPYHCPAPGQPAFNYTITLPDGSKPCNLYPTLESTYQLNQTLRTGAADLMYDVTINDMPRDGSIAQIDLNITIRTSICASSFCTASAGTVVELQPLPTPPLTPLPCTEGSSPFGCQLCASAGERQVLDHCIACNPPSELDPVSLHCYLPDPDIPDTTLMVILSILSGDGGSAAVPFNLMQECTTPEIALQAPFLNFTMTPDVNLDPSVGQDGDVPIIVLAMQFFAPLTSKMLGGSVSYSTCNILGAGLVLGLVSIIHIALVFVLFRKIQTIQSHSTPKKSEAGGTTSDIHLYQAMGWLMWPNLQHLILQVAIPSIMFSAVWIFADATSAWGDICSGILGIFGALAYLAFYAAFLVRYRQGTPNAWLVPYRAKDPTWVVTMPLHLGYLPQVFNWVISALLPSRHWMDCTSDAKRSLFVRRHSFLFSAWRRRAYWYGYAWFSFCISIYFLLALVFAGIVGMIAVPPPVPMHVVNGITLAYLCGLLSCPARGRLKNCLNIVYHTVLLLTFVLTTAHLHLPPCDPVALCLYFYHVPRLLEVLRVILILRMLVVVVQIAVHCAKSWHVRARGYAEGTEYTQFDNKVQTFPEDAEEMHEISCGDNGVSPEQHTAPTEASELEEAHAAPLRSGWIWRTLFWPQWFHHSAYRGDPKLLPFSPIPVDPMDRWLHRVSVSWIRPPGLSQTSRLPADSGHSGGGNCAGTGSRISATDGIGPDASDTAVKEVSSFQPLPTEPKFDSDFGFLDGNNPPKSPCTHFNRFN
eukprot:gene2820-559_t